jgi:hypothetical protein
VRWINYKMQAVNQRIDDLAELGNGNSIVYLTEVSLLEITFVLSEFIFFFLLRFLIILSFVRAC